MPNLVIRPTMFCPCGSRWVSVSCCYDRTDNKFRKRIPSIEPPAPKTGYAHRGCYLRGTKDCSTDISGEHYMSASILRQISFVQGGDGVGVTVRGMPWQKPEQSQTLSVKNLTANILCKRHNEALAPLDQEAGIFFSTLQKIFAAIDSKRVYRKLSLDLVSGSAIEQWMLKVACGIFFSVATDGGVKLSNTHTIDLEKVERAFFADQWDDRAGLYFNGHHGSIMKREPDIGFAPLSDGAARRFAGTRVNLLGFEMDLAFDTTGIDPRPLTGLTRRPTELVFVSPERRHLLLLSWPKGTPDSALQLAVGD